MVSSIGILVSLYCAASAHCDLHRFDQTPPRAISDIVSNQFADFTWASDVDTIDGRLWVWHYILNTHKDSGLGAVWEKADIRIPLTHPLPPGEAFCNRFLAASVLPNPDTDAPIVYGTNQQRQRAAVFVAEKPPKVGETSSSISTTYSDESGKAIDVNVQLTTSKTTKGFSVYLEHSPDLVIGISGLPRALSESQFKEIRDTVGNQNSAVERATYFGYAKADPQSVFDSNSADHSFWNGLDPKADYLFFSGTSTKIGFEVPAENTVRASADLIVLDKKLRPILATNVSLLVPSPRQ
jgi:hypothetical protein